MRATVLRTAAAATALILSAAAFAAEFGTAEEARAMLDRVIAAMKADPAAAMAKFNAGDPEFRDRDLYPFCIGADGTTTAHLDPAQLGKHTRDLKDVDGKAFGEEMMKTGEEGKIAEVTYKWPRPDMQEPVAKVSYVTKIGDQTCGVGYYK